MLFNNVNSIIMLIWQPIYSYETMTEEHVRKKTSDQWVTGKMCPIKKKRSDWGESGKSSLA